MHVGEGKHFATVVAQAGTRIIEPHRNLLRAHTATDAVLCRRVPVHV
jgi:hypothetical protein